MAYPAAAETASAPEPAQIPHLRTDVRGQLDRTSRAVLAADEAYLRGAIESVSWSRTGVLGRLTRARR
jgi:hypothetical protein